MKQFLALVALSISVAACGKNGTAVAAGSASTPDTSAGQVAVTVGGRSFSNAELDVRLKEDMASLKTRAAASEEQLRAQLADVQSQVKEQEFNLRKKALTEMLFDMEAQARGITRDALLAQEISAKSAITTADTDA